MIEQDGKVCHPVNRVRRLTVLRPLDHPCHVAKAFGALTRQQQVATLDGAAEIGNRRFVAAGAAPDAAGLAPAGVRPCWAHIKRPATFPLLVEGGAIALKDTKHNWIFA